MFYRLMKSIAAGLVMAAATLSIATFAALPAAASIVTFVYDNPALDGNLPTWYTPDVGAFKKGGTVSVFMALSFDTETAPTTSVPGFETCVNLVCGLTGTAWVGGHTIPSSLSQVYNEASYGQDGVRTASLVAHIATADGIPADGRYAQIRFGSDNINSPFIGTPPGPPLLANFDFTVLSRTTLLLYDITQRLAGPTEQATCGFYICDGVTLQIGFTTGEEHVTILRSAAPPTILFDASGRPYISTQDSGAVVPEPSSIALIGMALLSLFGFGLMRRRDVVQARSNCPALRGYRVWPRSNQRMMS